jgi:hypothetical protein
MKLTACFHLEASVGPYICARIHLHGAKAQGQL